jgi:hypothetical protein
VKSLHKSHSAKFRIFSSRKNLDLLDFFRRKYSSVIKYYTKGFYFGSARSPELIMKIKRF